MKKSSNVKRIKQRGIEEEHRETGVSEEAEQKSFKNIINTLRETSSIFIHLKQPPQNSRL